MEKRRRARINQSLNEIKSLVLDALKKDVSIKFKPPDATKLENLQIVTISLMKNKSVIYF